MGWKTLGQQKDRKASQGVVNYLFRSAASSISCFLSAASSGTVFFWGYFHIILFPYLLLVFFLDSLCTLAQTAKLDGFFFHIFSLFFIPAHLEMNHPWGNAGNGESPLKVPGRLPGR
jgi:hypothetical protein